MPLGSKPVTLFSLPLDQLHALEEQAQTAAEAVIEAAPPSPPALRQVDALEGCSTCGTLELDGTAEWRQHFRSDFHRFNLKRRTAGLEPVTEPEWEVLNERDDVSSISGSEGSDSEAEDQSSSSSSAGRQPHLVLGSHEGSRLAVWRALVAPDVSKASCKQPSTQDCLTWLRRLRQQGGRFAVIMLQGGHFCAAVFAVNPQQAGNTKLSEKERFPMVAHKSAHRYVVRAGQGGRQSAKDASGKFARSAGSSLRRANEVALQKDVETALRDTLKQALDSCALIFLHAPGSNSQQLLGGEAPVLDKADQRLRRVPFTTRRPTLKEAQRVMRLLFSVWTLEQEPEEGGMQGDDDARAAAAAHVVAVDRERQRAIAVQQAAVTAAEQAAAEAKAKQKRAEKKAKQKARQQQQRQEHAAGQQRDEGLKAEDEILAALGQVEAASHRLEARPATVGKQQGKASAARVTAMSTQTGDDPALRRARLAAAAEQRMCTLQAAIKQQQLH